MHKITAFRQFTTWGNLVFKLSTMRSITSGLYSARLSFLTDGVRKSGLFTTTFPSLYQGFSATFKGSSSSVFRLFLPTIHSTYNNDNKYILTLLLIEYNLGSAS